MAANLETVEAALSASRKILFLLNRSDVESTQGRILRLINGLADGKNCIDVLVHNHELHKEVENYFINLQAVNVIIQKGKSVYWEPQRRDDFVKIFIQQNMDMLIPGTDLPYWKTAAFDDFRGHISSHVYCNIDSNYDQIIMSIPSADDPLASEADIMATTVLFHAREMGIKTVGLQIYPAEQCPRIYMNMLDSIIVRSDTEKKHYLDNGCEQNKIRIMSDKYDNYCIDTIEDTYKNMIYDEQIKFEKKSLSILVLNHAKYRAQMKQAIDVIAELSIEKTVSFAKSGYEIRDLSEDDIFNDLIRPSLDKLKSTYYIVDASALAKMLMMCDVVIASTYIAPLIFANRYKKTAIIFNPTRCVDETREGIIYSGQEATLKQALVEAYQLKLHTDSFAELLAECANGS